MSLVDDHDVVHTGRPFSKIEAVTPHDDFAIEITWNGGRRLIVDLAPSIMTYRIFAPLRRDRALFESVHLVDPHVIAWGDDDAIDMHVSELDHLAGTVMRGEDFQAFLDEMGFTWDAAAAQLGVSRRTIGHYVKTRELPRYMAFACAYLAQRKRAENLS